MAGLVVLGVDPGTRRLGWGIVARDGTRLRHVAHGVVRMQESAPLADRLVAIERGLVEVLDTHRVGAASVEGLFFHRDAQAAAKLGHARGVVLLVCARVGLAVHEYPPARVKLTVTGAGRAEKTQVAMMIRALLGLPETPPADAADALAIAVTHLQHSRLVPAVNTARRRAV